MSAYRAARTSDALCTVTASVALKVAGTVEAVLPGPYPQGTATTHDGVAAKGYVFSGWTLDGKAARGGATGFRVPAGDHTLLATFKKGTTSTSTVTTKTSGGGTVKKAPAKRAEPAGADLLHQATPATGWSFAGRTLDGASAGNADTVGIDVGAHDMELVATFEQRRHALELECEGGRGRVSLSQDGPYADGATVIATAVPEPGSGFVGWRLDGEAYGGDADRDGGETAITFEETGHTDGGLRTGVGPRPGPDVTRGHIRAVENSERAFPMWQSRCRVAARRDVTGPRRTTTGRGGCGWHG
ncbi:hypothetical protein [Streptomyces sp. NPDC091278]|uniref:InlB B-repeat-containing protein n=1 Tax=Streptomyces sp. NPDC091278 TaxID=3155301 RepID=UPI00344CBA06